MAKIKTGEVGYWSRKVLAERYARDKNRRSRKYRYQVKRPSFYGRPGFSGVKAGWTVLITRK